MIGNARPGKLFRPGPGRPGLSRLVPMFKHSVVDLGDSNLPATGPPVGHAIIVGQSVSNAATF